MIGRQNTASGVNQLLCCIELATRVHQNDAGFRPRFRLGTLSADAIAQHGKWKGGCLRVSLEKSLWRNILASGGTILTSNRSGNGGSGSGSEVESWGDLAIHFSWRQVVASATNGAIEGKGRADRRTIVEAHYAAHPFVANARTEQTVNVEYGATAGRATREATGDRRVAGQSNSPLGHCRQGKGMLSSHAA